MFEVITKINITLAVLIVVGLIALGGTKLYDHLNAVEDSKIITTLEG